MSTENFKNKSEYITEKEPKDNIENKKTRNSSDRKIAYIGISLAVITGLLVTENPICLLGLAYMLRISNN
jgi:hypothetical protein